MSEWPRCRLVKLAANEKSAISKPYGSAILQSDYRSSGIPVVRGVNLARGIFHDDDFVFIDESLAERMPGAELHSGDLIVTHRGTIGQVSMIPRSPRFDRYVASTSHVKVRLDQSRAVPEFYYYWFASSGGRRTLLEHASAVGVPGIAQPVNTVKSLVVPHPPLVIQRGIAEVLGALDDKIAANDRLRFLVDDLLYAEFSRLALGRGTTKLREIADVNVESVKPKPGAHLRYLDISSVEQGVYTEPEKTSWESAPGRARRGLKFGDTVWSTVRPNRRSHALILDNDPLLVASTGLAVLSPKPGRVAGTYEAAKRDVFVNYLESVAEGSAYPAVRGNRFADAPIPDIDAGEWEAFEKKAFPLRMRAHSANVETRALKKIRDELLPLLMSGKVRVRDAEQVASEVL
jgi:type I restriction enzyme S subunit